MRPHIGDEELEAVREVFESGFLAQGPRVREFERRFAQYIGAKHAVATSSCTTALELAMLLCELGKGDEVIVPDFTFPATGNVVFHVGAKPVLVDVDMKTRNLDPEAVEKAITPRTKAIIVVHVFGHPADMDPILDIARKRGITVVEDAAPALGSLYKKKQVGVLGDIGCFSFHPRKILTTGEGGMLVTNDNELAEKAVSLKDHGKAMVRGESQFVLPGYNFRLSDVLAAIGIVQLAKFDEMIKKRIALAKNYTELLQDAHLAVEWPYEAPWARHTYQAYVTYLTSKFKLSRDDCILRLREKFGIEAQIGTYALHTCPAYSGLSGVNSKLLERSGRLFKNTLTLPLYHTLRADELDYVVECLKKLGS